MAHVFLDLDGTLTDPKPGITRSIRHALISLGHPAPDEDDLTWCIGPPLRQSFVKLLDGEAQADRALALYRERFSRIGLYENRVYDGVPEMLARLRDAGFQLSLATSKPHVYATRITAHFGLDRWLDHLFGSELDGTRTDKTELLAHALAETGSAARQSVMLGDREHDMIGARNNGIAMVGALWGYGSPAELESAGVASLATSPGHAARIITAPSSLAEGRETD